MLRRSTDVNPPTAKCHTSSSPERETCLDDLHAEGTEGEVRLGSNLGLECTILFSDLRASGLSDHIHVFTTSVRRLCNVSNQHKEISQHQHWQFLCLVKSDVFKHSPTKKTECTLQPCASPFPTNLLPIFGSYFTVACCLRR